MVDGILNIHKPSGRTSFSIVAMVRRLTRQQRVGHAGTLDPLATGVLPICLGQGTRIIEFLTDATKTYRAQIELGVATDTYDAGGRITQRGNPSGINQGQLESALNRFCGLIQQVPPMYSAVKYQGKRLYELARAGIEVERRSRPVKIHRLELLDWQPPIATIEVVCGKGTYIRSLAHDLGQSLGCGANLKSLTRLRCGIFDIKDAISVPQLGDVFRYGYWQQLVYPIDIVLSHLAAIIVGDDTGQIIKNGCPLVLEQSDDGLENRCRVYTPDGCFLGILRFNPEKEHWQPEKVLANKA
ncbi:tRNA pseudouridine(55) synthase TruB [Chloroflexota bacterium]